MRIEADAVAVGDSVDGVVPQQRAQFVDLARVQPLELGELRNLGIERVERLALLLPGMNQDRHAMPERDGTESLRRILEERSARQRQCAHQPMAENLHHRPLRPDEWKPISSSASRTMTPAWAAKPRRRQAPRPAADEKNVGIVRHPVRRRSRRWTTSPQGSGECL